MSKYQREATPVQKLMAALMGSAWLSFFIWTVPEIIGALSPEKEDTYSEWVWDLPGWAVFTIVALHVIAGVLLIGSAWHFVEGYFRRLS